MPSIVKESIFVLVKKYTIMIQGRKCTNYTGCKKILFQRRKSGIIKLQIPVLFLLLSDFLVQSDLDGYKACSGYLQKWRAVHHY